ncbi:hypothetical protein BG006_004290 [Podila minutissima]|uniref:Uncharacterized protein n=1 Tax=Podila minutissima TaxID=64525 RepID=A0A9P5VMF9_9FUNG|nr:hypothetical protein BG006_004290 [Podila minutissima]
MTTPPHRQLQFRRTADTTPAETSITISTILRGPELVATLQAFRERNNIKWYYNGFILQRHNKPQSLPRLAPEWLCAVLRLGTNLTTLTLMDQIPQYLPALLPAILDRQPLRHLVIMERCDVSDVRLGIADMFPVFQLFEALELNGLWYKPEFLENVLYFPDPHPTWNVHSLVISAREMTLLAFCPLLERLHVNCLLMHDLGMLSGPAGQCPRLQEIVLKGRHERSCFHDSLYKIEKLTALKKLCFNSTSSSPPSTTIWRATTALPMPSSGFLSRPKLKTLMIPITFGPEYRFEDHSELHQRRTCADLEELTTVPKFWVCVARQLAALSKLRRLSVDFINPRCHSLIETLFHAGGLPALEILELSGEKLTSNCIHHYLAAWLKLFPKLRQLVVPHYRASMHLGWLKGIRRPDIQVVGKRELKTIEVYTDDDDTDIE